MYVRPRCGYLSSRLLLEPCTGGTPARTGKSPVIVIMIVIVPIPKSLMSRRHKPLFLQQVKFLFNRRENRHLKGNLCLHRFFGHWM